ncbi:MAG: VOC family protein [Candidatus Cloacimonetes bacterium]|jgi:lactoylglutathione lyase|nr:VOC family protein [Candidatus Cloacimonadota bacterium]
MNVSFTTITVRNLEKSLTFYTKILKLQEAQRFSPHKGIDIVFLKDKENGKIELIEYEQMKEVDASERASIVSIGFAVEDLDATMKMLREKNIEIIRGPIQTPSGAKFIFIEDPDGVEIELIQGFNI